jgi:acylphosphatase
MERLHAFVRGRVQGVGFRYFVLSAAMEIQLTGWVRNRRDGSVEVLGEGTQENLDKLFQALQRGPSSSNVTAVDPEWGEASGEFSRFEIRGTL